MTYSINERDGPTELGVYLTPATPNELWLIQQGLSQSDSQRSWSHTEGLQVSIDSSFEDHYLVRFELEVVNLGHANSDLARICIAYSEAIEDPIAAHLARRPWWVSRTLPKTLGYFTVPRTEDPSFPSSLTIRETVRLPRSRAVPPFNAAQLTHLFFGVFDSLADPLDSNARSFFSAPSLFPAGPVVGPVISHIRKLSRQVACWAPGAENQARFTLVSTTTSRDGSYTELNVTGSTWMLEAYTLSTSPIRARLRVEGVGPGLIELPLKLSPLEPDVVPGSTMPGWILFTLLGQDGSTIHEVDCKKFIADDAGTVVDLSWNVPRNHQLHGNVVRIVFR
jgi:hypothetical protein